MDCRDYYLNLLENRVKRLAELIDISAPDFLIYREVLLINEAARPLNPDKNQIFNQRRFATG